MRLFAAIVPPRAEVEQLRQLVGRAAGPARSGTHKRGGLLGRLGGQAAPAAHPETDELTVPDIEQMYLPISGFGNVTLGDSVQLTKALRDEALTWPRPTLHFAGGTALEFKGDESVWAKLDGDVEALQAVGRGIPQVVQRLGFFVDRRQFRPWLSLGTITENTTAPFLQNVVDALEAHRGQPWTVEHVSLMKRVPEEGHDAFEEMEQLPLSDR